LILQVHARRSINQKAGDETVSQEKDVKSNLVGGNGLPRQIWYVGDIIQVRADICTSVLFGWAFIGISVKHTF
jgi:hypothetical protein